MRFVVRARGDVPLTVVLEPSGMEYVLEPGDHFVFEWVDEMGTLPGAFDHTSTSLTISEGSVSARMWNSRGDELSMIG
jgi:hypothetical protein